MALLEAMRPRQWTKNLIVFAGIIFAQQLFQPGMLAKVVIGFVLFCLLSSAVYIFNDLRDLEQDRKHPAKSQRPLASGRLGPGAAVAALVIMTVMGLGGAFWLGIPFGWVALAYWALMIVYSLWLKQVVILDVFAISLGFVLRAVAGAEVIAVEISPWLLVCTLLLALFLALGKRRHELVLLEAEAPQHRRILSQYSPYLLDQMIAVVTASTVLSYCLYTMWPQTVGKFGTTDLVYTVPFVLFGIFRYLYLIHQKGEGGSPDRVLLTDWPLILDLLLWIIAAGVILYWRSPW